MGRCVRFKRENKIKVIEGLDMSAQEVVDLRRDIVNARIEGMLYRAEEAGIKKGKMEIVINLLDSMSPEEIALKTNIPLDKILEIKNND